MLSSWFVRVACLAVWCALAAHPASGAPSSPAIVVVAAENFYGDIVGQIAGDHVRVTSIISDPNVDPHEYETNPRDAAAVANARLVVQNGLGYDAFIDHLVAASPNPQRKLIVVSELTGHVKGDNVHLWYDPATIPNPLEQTFDKRFVQNPRQRGFNRGGGGFGPGGSAPANPNRGGGGPKQPDPPVSMSHMLYASFISSLCRTGTWRSKRRWRR